MLRRALGLPAPACPWGYTIDQVERIMGDRLREFQQWNRGSTLMLCAGLEYNHETKEYQPNSCAPTGHGTIIYEVDVVRFLRGMRQDD